MLNTAIKSSCYLTIVVSTYGKRMQIDLESLKNICGKAVGFYFISMNELIHKIWVAPLYGWESLRSTLVHFAYSPLKVKSTAWSKHRTSNISSASPAMTSQQITANMVRKAFLVSRHGFFLRVTEDTVEGSQHRTEDVYSKFNYLVLYTHTYCTQLKHAANNDLSFRN